MIGEDQKEEIIVWWADVAITTRDGYCGFVHVIADRVGDNQGTNSHTEEGRECRPMTTARWR
jgi:hypothetical protein